MGVWEAITDAYDSLKQGLSDLESYARIEKELEKELVRTIYAPLKKNKRNSINSEFDGTVAAIAVDTKAGLHTIQNQLDEDIKGKFGKAIQRAMTKNNSKWDDV
ncbi:hypothetical protein [Streptococcus mutans]|uniref:hypothetical protein n=1 Tax=Streptococcus mutans TaxID=1309 RepID=UPI0028EBCB11|nr:hypothetical protein [Streptococcus mutans]MDT9487383.1 hypothetical protein [Streptococcus mutans]MDT9491058.1 hypothetical protein [Streptococcus mutans]MDT9508097.1 hypothetical protein [Streptococcus mutans]MDT9531976.1 hypothetical protein [Streptococcus mutans]